LSVKGACWWSVLVDDFEPLERRFLVFLPDGLREPAPLMLSFHGQGQDPEDTALGHAFNNMSSRSGMIVVYPQGIDDAADKATDQGTGWNVGTAGVNSTCIPEGVGNSSGCYKSCHHLGKCGPCNWSTCYDDVLFVRALLQKLHGHLAVDRSRVYLHGESNGAMFAHHLVQEMPGAFAAVAFWFGHPLLGFAEGAGAQLIRHAAELRESAMLTLHARSDSTIPIRGGVADGWIYEPLGTVMHVWAALHGCDPRPSGLPTSWDGGRLNFACHEYTSCTSTRRVIQCLYDGVHGEFPEGVDGDEITIWFFLEFSRGAIAI